MGSILSGDQDQGVLVEIVKAALVALTGMIPVFLFLYLQEPQIRWAVDEWIAQQSYRMRLREWTRRWSRLEGWEQEVWNHHQAPPAELRLEPPPGSVWS